MLSRRLDERTRELCAEAIVAGPATFTEVIAELRSALRQHACARNGHTARCRATARSGLCNAGTSGVSWRRSRQQESELGCAASAARDERLIVPSAHFPLTSKNDLVAFSASRGLVDASQLRRLSFLFGPCSSGGSEEPPQNI